MDAQYIEYMEKNLSKIMRHIPNLDIIKNFVRQGADLDKYFIYDRYARDRYGNKLPGQTLLYGLVRLIPLYSGTKSRLNRITEIMEYILNNGADVNEGAARIDADSRRVKGKIKSPLTYAIENRITPAIRILTEHDADVSLYDKNTWKSYIHDATNPHEKERLIEIMKLIQPGYVWRDPNIIEERNVPHNAENVISYEDIQNGDLMININNEMYGTQGALGEHSHFYKKSTWDGWEASQKSLGYSVTSPLTRQVVHSKNIYRAKLLPDPALKQEAEAKANANGEGNTKSNNSANSSSAATTTITASATAAETKNNGTRNNNKEGGKRRKQKKTRKLKRKI